MKFSSTVPMVRPRDSCTFIADSLTMVPMDSRCLSAAAFPATTFSAAADVLVAPGSGPGLAFGQAGAFSIITQSPIRRSRYRLPSTSQIQQPSPRSSRTGYGSWYHMPPPCPVGMSFRVRSRSSRERGVRSR